MDSGGSYISHDILHNGRKKRSAGSAGSSPHYRFSAFGQELHLELKPSAILSSHFIVQVLGNDGALETPEPAVQRCFYQGFIRNDSFSSVAVSTCAGLVSTPHAGSTPPFLCFVELERTDVCNIKCSSSQLDTFTLSALILLIFSINLICSQKKKIE